MSFKTDTIYWIILGLVVLASHWLLTPLLSPYFLIILLYAGINIILAVSLNLVNGITGQFSMGHAGFMSVGAYASAYITLWIQSSQPDLLQNEVMSQVILGAALFAGGLAAAVAGALVGIPSLRLKGDYLAIVTLGFGEIIRVLLLNSESVGAARGLSNIPALSNFIWIFEGAVLVCFGVHRLCLSAYGRSFLAVREDEIAARACGVNTTKAKVLAFVIGSFWAGIAGGLYAHTLQYLNPAIFDINRSFEVIIMVVMGGMGSISGSVLAAVFLSVLREALRPLQNLTGVDLRMIIYSLLLIILMLTRPKGLLQKPLGLFKRGLPKKTLAKGGKV